jgi:hypothetical protein
VTTMLGIPPTKRCRFPWRKAGYPVWINLAVWAYNPKYLF